MIDLSCGVGAGQQRDRLVLERDLDADPLEVVPGGDLAPGLVDRVHQLLSVEVADDVEAVVLGHADEDSDPRHGAAP